ncbi:MAG: serine hydrolase [Agathobacter sp.]|nr:serine hydrolase [Agathobacter sp.]
MKENELYSKACVLMDGDSGRILFGKNETLALANASTTKILTAIVCLENSDLDEIVTASAKAASQPKVHLGMKEGEQFYVRDLLYAMMLESFNDCAMALAEHVSGSMEGFAGLLNEKASQIGCTDTYFITPNGLDAENEESFHHTTAADLALLMKYCCWDSKEAKTFLEITQSMTHSFTNLSGKNYTVSNKNAFLSMMPEAISGKTGFTSAAGYCYVGAIESEGRKYTIALLACGWPNHRTYKWSDAKSLFGYGMEYYRAKMISFTDTVYSIEIVNGRKADSTLSDWGKKVAIPAGAVLTETNQSYLLAEEENFSYELELPKKIYRKVNAGDVVGKIKCYLNGACIAEKEIYINEGCDLWGFSNLFTCFRKAYFIM